MLLFGLFSWWYGDGWKSRSGIGKRRMQNAMDLFSINTLAGTLFKPWKQITTRTIGDEGLSAQFQAMVDNMVSRMVGFFVRVIMLVMGLGYVLLIGLFSLITMILWPVVPFVPIIILLLAFK
jgi:hypothetical protein